MKALVTHELAPSQAPRRGFVPLAVDFVQAKFIVIPLVFAAVLLVLGLLPYLGNLRGISPLLPLQHLGIRLSAIGNDRSLFSDWNTEALAFLASSIFCSIVYLFFTRFSGMAEKPGRFFGAGPIAATMILWPLSIRLGLLALVVAPITALHKPFESALVIGVLLLTGAYRLGLRSKIAGAVLARLGTAARVLISTALVAALFLVHLTLGMALLWLAAFFWVNRADSLPGVSRLPYSRWIFRNAILSTLFPLLLLPEFMESYNAYVRSRDDVRWIEQFEDQRVSENVYDIVATDAGAKVISATNEGFVLYKYSRWTGDYVRSKTIDTSSEIQTLDYFPSSGRVFAAGFDNDRAELAVFNSDFSEPTFIPVPGCRGAIQTRYRPIDDSVLITCEFSNSVVIHDLATGGQRTLNLPGWPHAAALSPDNRHLLVTSLTGLTPTLQINLDDATIEPSPTLLPGMVLGASDTLVRDLWF
ncbi:MAG: hypothetical protein M5R36_09775 [Deltaproteobacteria bacterium]|nr:hypothetical protein [Deltaproteobacteria bacterium]